MRCPGRGAAPSGGFLAYGGVMSQPPTEPSGPTSISESSKTAASVRSTSATSSAPARERSPLALAALAAVAVPGLNPARLALPQERTATLRTVGVVDTQGRHWEVLETHDDATGATLEAEAEVLRRIGRIVDDGRLSFNVPRPAGTLRQEGSHIQVRSHLEGRPIDVEALRPGPGLSAGLGKALGELHDLPTTVVSEAGLPVYDAEDVRTHWLSLLDDAAATGKVPPTLLSRWEVALEDSALWRFRPVVVHGDLAPENVLTAGGAVVAIRGLGQAHVGDPAEDMAWVYASVPVDCLDSIESAYDLARTEGVDRHLRDRAELVSELSLARWLMHGVRSGSDSIIDDAVAMLADLADQVGDEPLVEPSGPRLAPVPGDKEPAEPEATTSEVKMVLVDEGADDADGGHASAETDDAGRED
ncbi:Predicted kinase, aminoglycoside phosphotransferase (APT) family [Actinomyces ruminicola]|uniref:Predicted kinase, aminoglycoside phosphotransferase (APT) family n=2 Tax=Actinomyces ruminicola TaxID=332524 RepID=A0A1H0C214_9ACTO|nr:Predicted kinase, aminoglycoside phosphotransferase (APT) family [Actinomyces ruminicola]